MVYVFICSGTTTDVQVVVLLLLYSRCLGINLVPDPVPNCSQLHLVISVSGQLGGSFVH